jgi:lipopolysaccharide export system ATP-binding protein
MTDGLQNTAQVKPGTAVSPSATPVTPPPVGDVSPPPAGAAVASKSRLEAAGLRKSYGARLVVKEVHLAVNAGEVVGLLGPNGAGKTTTFYMVVGLVRADAGDIRIDGQPISAKPIHQRSRLGLSYLPQEASIFRKLTVDENIRAVLELQYDPSGKALKPAEIDKRLDGLLNDLSLTHLRDSPAPALSGGERRRVEIARALATQPSYILLDEPLAGIDPIAVAEIRDLVKHLKDRGIGVLITDHNVRETLDIIDRAYIMHDGQVLMEGKPSEVVAHEDVRRVYLGEKFSL